MPIPFWNENKTPIDGPDLGEFQRTVLLWLLLFEGLVFIAWQLYDNQQLILLVAFFLHALAVWLVFRNVNLAGLVWASSVAMLVSLTVWFYQWPGAAGYLAIFPLLAAVVFGLLGGLAAQGIVVLLMVAFSFIFQDIPGMHRLVWPVIFGGLAFQIVGSFIRYGFIQAIQNYYAYYQWASTSINQARDEHLELIQIQEDLQLSNRELSRLTNQLKIANLAAEEARQAKETFVATVSHELRTPLNMIIGFSEVITQSPRVYGTRLPPALLADIALIQRNSQHLLELVNDVLDLSQVDMGNLSITRNRCSLHELIGEACDVIRPLFLSKGLYLETDLDEVDEIISCDQTRIREVIINLLSNAGRFTDQGGVRIQAKVNGIALHVAVSDTGPGISPENQAKLFEPFQQLDSSIRRKHGGSGLGLAISKRFVEMHGGQMGLESQVGQGTTFFFHLPIKVADGNNPEIGRSPAENLASRWINSYSMVDARQRPFIAALSKLVPRCVVLETGDIARRLFERYMNAVEVVTVRSSQEAVECLVESPTQLLVINHQNSQELQDEILADDRLPFGLPVITFWLPGSTDMADILNVAAYLIKPVTKDNLLGALEEFGTSELTVLIVDDNPEIQQLFGRILSSTGQKHVVLRASDGQQGLEMLRKRKPDVVVLDLVMPEMDGFAFLKQKASDPQICNVPVILVTAQDPAGIQHISRPVALARVGGFSPRQLLELVSISGVIAGMETESQETNTGG